MALPPWITARLKSMASAQMCWRPVVHCLAFATAACFVTQRLPSDPRCLTMAVHARQKDPLLCMVANLFV